MAVLCACTKEDPIVENVTEPESVSMPVFKATIEGPATKTSLGNAGKVNWENGDEVLMMFGTKDDGASAIYIYEATPDVDASSATLERTQVFIDDPNADKFVMAIYPASFLDMNAGGIFFPATQTYNGEDISFAPMFSKSSFLDSETPNNIVFKNGAALLKITVPQTQMANLTSITVSSDLVMNGEIGFDHEGYMFIIDDVDGNYPAVTPENSKITLNIPDGIAIPEGESKTFYIAIPPMSEQTEEAQADHYRYLQIDVTDGTTTKSMRTNKAGGIEIERNKIYPITFAENYSPAPAYEYVDLGLSVKWATMNVGATKPEEYGDYFAWGATETLYEAGYAQENPQAHWKDGKAAGYTFVNTPYQTANTTRSSSTKWTKYLGSTTSSYKDPSATDEDALKTVLDPEDDAAHVNWGGSWRMPTSAELDELLNTDNCTWTWCAKDNTEFNGIAGYKVQSKKVGYTDKWIFLPAAGYRNGSELKDVDSSGRYWSSSFSTDSPYYAYSLNCDNAVNNVYRNGISRYYGRSVRPVCE